MSRHTDRSVRSSKGNKRRLAAARRRAVSPPTRTLRSATSPAVRALVTAAGLAGAIAVAGLAAWLLTDPATAAQQSQPSGQAQQAFIDPTTGRLRPAEHDDFAPPPPAIAGRFARTAAVESQAVELPDGSVVATVPEELHTFSVATRTPDGRIVFEHATGATQAAALVRDRSANVSKKPEGLGKEARDDR